MPNWPAIKAEYITTDISYRDLAAKKGVAVNTLSARAKREKWVTQRRNYRDKLAEETVQKVASKKSTESAKKLATLQKAADNMGTVIAGIFDDLHQFNRYIVQEKKGFDTNTSEKIFEKVDTKAIKELSSAMRDIAYVLRNVYDIPTVQEQKAMDLADEKLQLDKKKAESDSDSDRAITVRLEGVVQEWAE